MMCRRRGRGSDGVQIAPGYEHLHLYPAEATTEGAGSVREAESGEHLNALVSFLPALPMPEGTAQQYREIRAALESKDERIGGNDLWIAASAVHIEAPLLTADAVFDDVPGLRLHR